MYGRLGLYHLARYHQEQAQAAKHGERRRPQDDYGHLDVFLRLSAVLLIAGSVGGAFYCVLS
ncbi:hypothetical protein [Rhizobium sp. LCM 4573]|uniref:hypothetical protein n=1 Tax=Rhizobium sp. LCM 4573 TaxID=1848291 RepID=UPI0008D90302|nr:hypothetical protein [Rhizobium sp. LCM 4573]OHV76063.1 hypothetical protein LCM4573_15610 [Rhizobium sp. LCM 4573]